MRQPGGPLPAHGSPAYEAIGHHEVEPGISAIENPQSQDLGAQACHPQSPLAVAPQQPYVGRPGPRTRQVEVGQSHGIPGRPGGGPMAVPGGEHRRGLCGPGGRDR